MITSSITFKNGVTLPTIAVYSQKDLIQNAYRECFEIRFPTEEVTLDEITALADPVNLTELLLTEHDSETGEVTAQFAHFNFTIITGMGMKTTNDGSKYMFLSVAQKSDAELEMEQLKQDNEDIQSALIELAGIVSEV